MRRLILSTILTLTILPSVRSAESNLELTKKGLQELNHLIGEWRGTGTPLGSPRERREGFWVEHLDWQWQFEKSSIWLRVDIKDGKYFKKGELRYLPKEKKYKLTLTTKDKKTLVFQGEKEGRRLVLDRSDSTAKQDHRMIFTLLHSNRYLFRYESKPSERTRYKKIYQVGVTKKDVPFAGKGDSYPECIVSGGRGTMAVSFKGKTYYVCCTGCRNEFNDNPEKYIKEYEAKQAKKK